jgi:hypothetical protein
VDSGDLGSDLGALAWILMIWVVIFNDFVWILVIWVVILVIRLGFW